MTKPDLADGVADAVLSGPEPRGGGFYRYDRYRVTLDSAWAFERDVVRIGRVVVMLPVDLERDEVVLIRQFRLGAHLALGKGDMIEVPAGRVEQDEQVMAAARRECREEIGVTPSMPRTCPSGRARWPSRSTSGPFACRSTTPWKGCGWASCTTARRCSPCNGSRSIAGAFARSPRNERDPGRR
jgi:hypothetical protein